MPCLSLFGWAVYSLPPNGRFQPYKHKIEVERKFQKVSILPSFQGGMLMMRIGNFCLSNTFKLGSNGPIAQLHFRQHQMCTLQVLCTICSLHSIFTPAFFGMPTKPTCGFGITFVQEPADIPPIFPSTSSGCTLKHMDMTTVYTLHPGFSSKEDINR